MAMPPLGSMSSIPPPTHPAPLAARPRSRPRHPGWRWAAVSAWLAAQACGGSAGSAEPGDPASESLLLTACEALCDKRSECRGEAPDDEPCSECVDDPPLMGVFRQDFVQSVLECIEGLACDESDDACVDQAIEAVPDASPAVFTRCQVIKDGCTNIGDDTCKLAIAFTDAARERFDACLDEGCPRVAECIDGLGTGEP
jgi:hypothetical protein